MDVPISDSANLIDCNPFSSDDEIPLTKYSETSKSCITSKEETVSDSDSTEGDNGLTESKENVSEHDTTLIKQTHNCPYCPMKCTLKYSLLRHIRIMHASKISEFSKNESKNVEQDFQCPYCPAKLKVKKSVNRHIKSLHPKEYLGSTKNISTHNELGFQCPYCPAKLKVKTSIRRHIRDLHPKEFVEYSINPPTMTQVTLNSSTILLEDEFSQSNDHTEDSQIIIENFNRSIDKLTTEEDTIHFTMPNNDSAEISTENQTHKVESIDVEHQNSTTKQAYICPTKITSKKNVSLHIKKLHPKEFAKYAIKQPKNIQMDLEFQSTISNNEFSDMINKRNNTKVPAETNTERNKNIIHTTDCYPLSSDDEDSPLTKCANINSKEAALDIDQSTQKEGKFKCNICGKKLKRASYLREHAATHADKTFQCIHCTKKFKVKKYLRHHIQNVHATLFAQYQCNYCPSEFKMKESIQRHVKKFHPKEFMKYSKTKSKHYKTIPPPDTTQNVSNVKCSICSKEFKSSSLLRQHMKSKHTGYQCRHCPETFQKREDLNHHFQHSHPTEYEIFSDYDGFIAKWEKELECYVCKNKFANFSLLNKHFEVEHPKDKCYILCCGLKLGYRLALVEHIRFHSDPNFFTCKVCGKRNISGRTLRIHMRYHLKDTELQCKVCKKYFISKSKLLLHSGIHMTEKRYKCKVCGKGFSTELLQKKHELNYHRGKRLCDQCGKSFYNLNSLKQHLLVHDGAQKSADDTERPVAASLNLSCEICGSKFKTHMTLNTHKRSFHADDSKAYVCSVCGKMYASKMNLDKHKEIVHTTKRFRCNMCDKEFKYIQSFRQHKETHNLKSRIRCTHCTSRFTRKENFYRHLKIYHPEEYAKITRRKKTKADFSSVKETIVI